MTHTLHPLGLRQTLYTTSDHCHATTPAQGHAARRTPFEMDEGTKAPPEFFCPISNELMRDPVTTTDGHCYERQSLIKWFEEHKDAADCMNPPTFEWMGKRTEPLGSSTTTNNMMLQRSILRWEERYSKVLQRKSLTPVECTPPHSPSKTFCSATKISVGSFKEVHRAILCLPGASSGAGTHVAVLKIRDGSVAAEADTLLKLGRHMHLVDFIGQCKDGPNNVLLVTEFAPLGDLESFMGNLEEDCATIPFQHKCAMLEQVYGNIPPAFI